MEKFKFPHLSRNNWIAISSIIVLILGIFIGAFYQNNLDMDKLKEQQQNDRKISAQAFLTEINRIEPLLNTLQPFFQAEEFDFNSSPYSFYQPLYQNNGLYFSMTEDIGKFDRNLSRNLYKFYDALNGAERDRKKIIDDEEFYRSCPNYEGTNIAGYKNQLMFEAKLLTYDMRLRVVAARNLIPSLKEELNAYINK